MHKRVEIGQMVKSITGRDQGRFYLILEIDPAKGYVVLVDGAKRGIGLPKRKNINHIQTTHHIDRDFQDQLAQGHIPRDQEIRKYLQDKDVD